MPILDHLQTLHLLECFLQSNPLLLGPASALQNMRHLIQWQKHVELWLGHTATMQRFLAWRGQPVCLTLKEPLRLAWAVMDLFVETPEGKCEIEFGKPCTGQTGTGTCEGMAKLVYRTRMRGCQNGRDTCTPKKRRCVGSAMSWMSLRWRLPHGDDLCQVNNYNNGVSKSWLSDLVTMWKLKQIWVKVICHYNF
jgi:hypothetical protein